MAKAKTSPHTGDSPDTVVLPQVFSSRLAGQEFKLQDGQSIIFDYLGRAVGLKAVPVEPAPEKPAKLAPLTAEALWELHAADKSGELVWLTPDGKESPPPQPAAIPVESSVAATVDNLDTVADEPAISEPVTSEPVVLPGPPDTAPETGN